MFSSWSKDYNRRASSDIKKRVDKHRQDFLTSPPGLFALSKSPEIALLYKYIRPRLDKITIIGFLNLFGAFLGAVRVVILIFVLGSIVGESVGMVGGVSLLGVDLSLESLERWLFSEYGVHYGLAILVVLTIAVDGLAFFTNRMARRIQAQFSFQVRTDLIDKLFSLEMDYFDDTKSGDIAYLQNALVNRFSFMLPGAQALFSAMLNLAVSIGLLFLMSGWLTLFLGLLGVVILFLVSRLEGRTRVLSYQAEESSRIAGTHFLETLYGVRLVKQGGQEKRVRQKYLEFAWAREMSSINLQDYQEISGAISRFSGFAALIAAAYGASFLSGINLLENVGLGIGYIYLAMRMFNAVNGIQALRLRIASMVPQFMMVAEFLLNEQNLEADVVVPKSAIDRIENGISVENLSFRYDLEKGVLDEVTLDFPVGTMTALVGLSGSGKTTLLELLAKIRIPQSGKILIDGADLSEIDAASYRPLVGYVNQETIIFHDTLMENIRYLRPDATQRDVDFAAKLAIADEFVAEMDMGYDTVVGERGAKISGGQRQRIVIARVLLQDPPVLLLDEATSSLDLLTESKIYENLMKLKDQKIIIVAAHRLSAITHFDNIVLFHEGRVVERGNHSELISARGMYYHLYSLQGYTSGEYSEVLEAGKLS